MQPKFPNGYKQMLIDESVNKTITILFAGFDDKILLHNPPLYVFTMDIEITGSLCNIVAIFLEFI